MNAVPFPAALFPEVLPELSAASSGAGAETGHRRAMTKGRESRQSRSREGREPCRVCFEATVDAFFAQTHLCRRRCRFRFCGRRFFAPATGRTRARPRSSFPELPSATWSGQPSRVPSSPLSSSPSRARDVRRARDRGPGRLLGQRDIALARSSREASAAPSLLVGVRTSSSSDDPFAIR